MIAMCWLIRMRTGHVWVAALRKLIFVPPRDDRICYEIQKRPTKKDEYLSKETYWSDTYMSWNLLRDSEETYQKRRIYVKRDLLKWHIYVTRDLVSSSFFFWKIHLCPTSWRWNLLRNPKETYKKWRIYVKRDLLKWHTYVTKDLGSSLSSKNHLCPTSWRWNLLRDSKETYKKRRIYVKRNTLKWHIYVKRYPVSGCFWKKNRHSVKFICVQNEPIDVTHICQERPSE